MRVVRRNISAHVEDSVSVLVPMRNEEHNVDGLVNSLTASTGLKNWDFTVLNDGSTDATGSKLAEFQIGLIDGSPLPSGWLGKNWACAQLANSASGEYLVFIDADVRLDSTAIAAAVAMMKSLQWEFISPYPRQIAKTWIERLIQPLLQWSWLSSVPLRLAQRFRISSMTIANGQFFIVKRSAYEKVGGHASIKGEVLDDLRLARLLINHGFSGGVAEGSQVAECRMYETTSSLVQGYTKSLWNAFGGFFGTFFTVVLLIATQILPLLLGLSGSLLGWLAYFMTALTHGVAAARTKSTPTNVFMHPIAACILIILIVQSLRRKRSGTLTWRERTLP